MSQPGPWGARQLDCFYRVWRHITVNHVEVDLARFVVFEKVHLHGACMAGHLLTDDNSVWYPVRGVQYRRCRLCYLSYQREYNRTRLKKKRQAARRSRKKEKSRCF